MELSEEETNYILAVNWAIQEIQNEDSQGR